MANRTSAYFFAHIFKTLASDPTPQHRIWARDLWRELFPKDNNSTMMSLYGFRPYQMDCDRELIVLGIARWGHPLWEDVIIYGLEHGTAL